MAGYYPVLTITGPRQSGKTTLAKALFPDKRYLNLERPDIRAMAQADPTSFLRGIRRGAILDKIQKVVRGGALHFYWDDSECKYNWRRGGEDAFPRRGQVRRRLGGAEVDVRTTSGASSSTRCGGSAGREMRCRSVA